MQVPLKLIKETHEQELVNKVSDLAAHWIKLYSLINMLHEGGVKSIDVDENDETLFVDELPDLIDEKIEEVDSLITENMSYTLSDADDHEKMEVDHTLLEQYLFFKVSIRRAMKKMIIEMKSGY